MPVITFTKARTYQECPEKFHHREIELLHPRVKREAQVFGGNLHRALEIGEDKAIAEIREASHPMSQTEADKQAVTEAMISGACRGLKMKFGPEPAGIEREPEFLLPLINPDTGRLSQKFMLGGKADWIYQDGRTWTLGEAKTRGTHLTNADIAKLDLDQQVLNEVAGLQTARGITVAKVEYLYIFKPSIRQKQTETVDQYCARIIEDYQERPDFYFHQETIYIDQARVTTWERDLWRIVQAINWSVKRDWWYRNTSRCAEWSGCEYLPLCRGDDVTGLYEIGESSPELQEVAHVGITR